MQNTKKEVAPKEIADQRVSINSGTLFRVADLDSGNGARKESNYHQ